MNLRRSFAALAAPLLLAVPMDLIRGCGPSRPAVDCRIIVGFPFDASGRQGDWTIYNLGTYSEPEWAAACAYRWEAMKIDHSPNDPQAGPRFDIFLHFPTVFGRSVYYTNTSALLDRGFWNTAWLFPRSEFAMGT